MALQGCLCHISDTEFILIGVIVAPRGLVNPVPRAYACGFGALPCKDFGTFIPALTHGAFCGTGRTSPGLWLWIHGLDKMEGK
jgi:hypothetical protein